MAILPPFFDMNYRVTNMRKCFTMTSKIYTNKTTCLQHDYLILRITNFRAETPKIGSNLIK